MLHVKLANTEYRLSGAKMLDVSPYTSRDMAKFVRISKFSLPRQQASVWGKFCVIPSNWPTTRKTRPGLRIWNSRYVISLS